MRRPTIRLGYVLELVATAAVCFGLIRMVFPPPVNHGWRTPASGWVRIYGGSLLTGMVLTGGVGLAVETIRGRRPASWGLGRWIWSIAALFMVFYAAEQVILFVIDGRLRALPSDVVLRALLERMTIHQFFGGFAWTIAALCATAMIARTPRDPEPDAREWAGRIFASLAVALNIAEPLLRAAGR